MHVLRTLAAASARYCLRWGNSGRHRSSRARRALDAKSNRPFLYDVCHAHTQDRLKRHRRGACVCQSIVAYSIPGHRQTR